MRLSAMRQDADTRLSQAKLSHLHENEMIKRTGFGDKARFGQSLKYRSFVSLLYVYLQGCGGPDRTGMAYVVVFWPDKGGVMNRLSEAYFLELMSRV